MTQCLAAMSECANILPNRHGSLNGMISDEEVQDKHSVDAGEYPPRVHVDFLHLK